MWKYQKRFVTMSLLLSTLSLLLLINSSRVSTVPVSDDGTRTRSSSVRSFQDTLTNEEHFSPMQNTRVGYVTETIRRTSDNFSGQFDPNVAENHNKPVTPSIIVVPPKLQGFGSAFTSLYAMPLVPSRPRNVSRTASPHYPWGNHVFGPLEYYLQAPLGTASNGYFNHETIAVVLEATDKTILNCTLLEVRPVYEQKVALKTLGQVMPLVPLSLKQMIVLVSYCSTPHDKLPPPTTTPKTAFTQTARNSDDLFLHASSAFMGILPGTLWCGISDRARVYHQLGQRHELDRCCRAHDHCPVKLRAGVQKYGTKNSGFTTVSHCHCDEIFMTCLENAKKYDEVAEFVGNLFFNIVRPQCLAPAKPKSRNYKKSALVRDDADTRNKSALICILTDKNNMCRQWINNPEVPELKLRFVRPKFTFPPES